MTDRLVFSLLAGLLLFAPLLRGGNRQVAMMVMLALGLSLIAVLVARGSFHWFPFESHTAPRPEAPPPAVAPQPVWWWVLILLVATSPLWLSALQLIPIDARLWASLAGREAYLPALTSAGIAPPTSLPLSLAPQATWTAMWSALPLTAAFLAALTLDRAAIEKLLGILMFVALVQAVLALFQLVQGADSFFYFNSLFPGGFIGTFNNRNHLADLFAMLIPVWFYFLLLQYKLGISGDGHSRGHSRSHSRSIRSAIRPMWLFFGFALMVLILSTQSRGGLFASMVVLTLSTIVFLDNRGARLSVRQHIGVFAGVVVFGLAALASVGLEGIGSRLEANRLRVDADIRGAFSEQTFAAALEFWPWGSGVGSFESVFPRFQNMLSTGFVAYAHNDYPQLLMELGAPVLIIAVALLILIGAQARRLVGARNRVQRHDSMTLALRWFCALGALALLLHSWVEFNMHIPALALTATFLLGSYLRPLSSNDVNIG